MTRSEKQVLIGLIAFGAVFFSAAALGTLAHYNQVPQASPSAIESDTSAMLLQAHRDGVIRCAREGGHPVVGFGFRVVCLEPTQVKWSAP